MQALGLLRRSIGAGEAANAAAGAAPADDAAQPGSRAELLQQIQDLLEKNQRVETRFRDVVGAYKSVLKEKEALEKTVGALTSTATTATPTPSFLTPSGPVRDPDDSGASDAEGGAPATPSVTPSASASAEDLPGKVRTLSQALRVLTAEKNTLQARFTTDKRLVAEQHRAALELQAAEAQGRCDALVEDARRAREERDAMKEAMVGLTQQLMAGHEASIHKNSAWEKERKVHADEVAGLQRQLKESGQSRLVVAELELKLRRARDAELEALTALNAATDERTAVVADLQQQLVSVKGELQLAITRSEGDEVLRLKQELRTALKSSDHFRAQAQTAREDLGEAMQSAQARVDDAEKRLHALQAQREESDAMIARERLLQESRLSELSTLVGRYEHGRAEDGKTMAALRERVLELNDEVRQLKEGAMAVDASQKSRDDSAVAALQDKVAQLKLQLAAATQQKPVDPTVECTSPALTPPPWRSAVLPSNDNDSDELVSEAVREVRAVCERYYAAAVAAVQEQLETQRLLGIATRQRLDAEQRLASARSAHAAALQQACDSSESEKTALMARLTGEMQAQKSAHEAALTAVNERHTRARERTIALLDDRDSEIARLRRELAACSIAGDDNAAGAGAGTGASVERGAGDRAGHDPEGWRGLSVGGPLLHAAAMEQTRAGQLAAARAEVQALHTQCVEEQERAALLQEQTLALKEEIRRLERNAKREGANLEYLKNILVAYLTHVGGRERTVSAIATILHFSPAELARVREAASSASSAAAAWWPSSTQ